MRQVLFFLILFLICSGIVVGVVAGCMQAQACSHWQSVPIDPTIPQTCLMVIAAYKEDLTWLQEFNHVPQLVYSKHNDTNVANSVLSPNVKCMTLPNVGRCDHTYLHHIVSNYNDLADVTIFLTASTKMIQRKRYTLNTIILPRIGSEFDCLGQTSYVYPSFQLDGWQCTHKQNQSASQFIRCPLRPFGKWWKVRFPSIPFPFFSVYGGVFAASKRAIQRVPMETWQLLLEEQSEADNLEVSHYMERSWFQLLTYNEKETKDKLDPQTISG